MIRMCKSHIHSSSFIQKEITVSNKFRGSLAIVVGAMAVAGLARAESADGPSYPVLSQIQSASKRAEVQAAARVPDAMQNQWQASADGASYPALGFIRSMATRDDVRAAARTDAAE